jgi:hypothetical protein
MSRHIFIITSIIYASQARKTSNFLQTILDIYLVRTRVKRRVFKTLSSLGICHGYKTANKRLKSLANSAKVRITSYFPGGMPILLYYIRLA